MDSHLLLLTFPKKKHPVALEIQKTIFQRLWVFCIKTIGFCTGFANMNIRGLFFLMVFDFQGLYSTNRSYKGKAFTLSCGPDSELKGYKFLLV